MTTPLFKMPEIAEGVANQTTIHNQALRLMEAVSVRVLSKDVAAPPAAVEGDSYIIPAGATGAWSGKTNQIAAYIGGGWSYVPPFAGQSLRVNALNAVYYFDGAGWLAEGATGAVTSVNGQAGPEVTLTAADVGADASGAAAAAVTAHVAATDPHAQYALESTIGQAGGIASLGGDGKVPASQLPASATTGGTVTSVGLTTPGVLFDVAGSPVTGAGTLALTLKTQAANKVLAGPATGAAAAPTMRALVAADLPVMVGSGGSHAAGIVPDPGATAGATRFLCENGTWAAPSPGSSSSGASSGVADTVPVLSAYSWLNQGAATATQETYGISMFAPLSYTRSVRALLRPISATPYQYVVRMKMVIPATNSASAGLVWYNSSSGSLSTVGRIYNTGNAFEFGLWNTATSYSSAYTSGQALIDTPEWMRLRDDGTYRYFEASTDGKLWVTIYRVARTNFHTPTHVGFYINTYNQIDRDSSLTVFSETLS